MSLSVTHLGDPGGTPLAGIPGGIPGGPLTRRLLFCFGHIQASSFREGQSNLFGELSIPDTLAYHRHCGLAHVH